MWNKKIIFFERLDKCQWCCIINSQYFPKSCRSPHNVNIKLGLTKPDVKKTKGIDRKSFAKKVNLVSLKSNVDKLDIDKFLKIPTNLHKLKPNIEKLDVNKFKTILIGLKAIYNLFLLKSLLKFYNIYFNRNKLLEMDSF